MFQEESAIFQEYVPYVQLHRCNQRYLCAYPKLSGYGYDVVYNVVFQRLHVMYLSNAVCYLYTAQGCPLSGRKAEPYGSECCVKYLKT